MAFVYLIFSLMAFAQTDAQLEKLIASNPDNVHARLRLAEIRLSQNKFKEVVELLNPYTDQLKGDGIRALAFAYSNLKDHANEVRVLTMMANRDEENYEWHMLLAHAYLKQANLTTDLERHESLITSGIQRLRRVLKLQPRYKPAFDLLLKTFLQQKTHNEARELLLEGIKHFGERPELYRELCRIDSNDGFIVQAIENCSKSIELSPNYPDHYVYLIQSLLDKKDQKDDVKAERLAVKAAKMFPKSEFVQWAAGTLFFRKKNYAVSSRYFKAAVKAKSDSARSHFGLAQSLYESGNEAQALNHFIAACKGDPTVGDTFHTAASRLKQKGNKELGSKYSVAAHNCR